MSFEKLICPGKVYTFQLTNNSEFQMSAKEFLHNVPGLHQVLDRFYWAINFRRQHSADFETSFQHTYMLHQS